MDRPLHRRAVMAGALGLAGGHASAAATLPFAEAPRLLIAGPEGGSLDIWAQRIAALMDAALPQALATRRQHVGGLDGVTAANQFDARVQPDGGTAMLVTGAPALAWLAGDSRAQFDVGRWLAIVVGFGPGVVIERVGAALPLRLPADGVAGPELAASLGMALLGRPTLRVPSVPDPIGAIAAGQIDVALLQGSDGITSARLATRAPADRGVAVAFSLGTPDALDGSVRRGDPDPMIPDFATAVARAGLADPVLLRGWHAVAAAAQLEFALVLPWLTPASVVAWWRMMAASLAAGVPDDQRVWIGTLPRDGGLLAGLALDPQASLRLRQWIGERIQR